MAKVDSNVEITLKKVRLSFEHIFKAQVPKPDKDGKVGTPTFNCAFLIPKKDEKQLDAIEDAIAESKEKMWGKSPPKIRSDRTPYRDGDEYEYDGYAANMVVSARNQRAPQVVHSKKDEDGAFVKLNGSEGVIYSGCYVNGIVRFWCQDSAEYGKRVNCSLEVVQFYSDGDAFSGATQVDANERLKGLEGTVEDEDPRTSGRRRERDGGRDRERGSTESAEDRPRRGRDSDGDRDRDGRDAPRSRDRDDEKVSPRSRDEDDTRSRRDARSSDRDEERGSDRERSRRDDAGSGRDRGNDADRGRDRPRSSSRDEEEDRPARRRSSSDSLI